MFNYNIIVCSVIFIWGRRSIKSTCIIVTNRSSTKSILNTREYHEHSWRHGLFMRAVAVRRFSTPIRECPLFVSKFSDRKKIKDKIVAISSFFFFSFILTTRISGDDFSSTLNLFIGYRFCRCSIHLSSSLPSCLINITTSLLP